MGYWGTGNLESDYAADEVGRRTGKMVNAFMRQARKKRSREWDEYDHTVLLVDFEILFALEAKHLLAWCSLPSPDEIEKLKISFLEDYDAYSDQRRPEFREVLVANFNRFKRICKKHAQK